MPHVAACGMKRLSPLFPQEDSLSSDWSVLWIGTSNIQHLKIQESFLCTHSIICLKCRMSSFEIIFQQITNSNLNPTVNQGLIPIPTLSATTLCCCFSGLSFPFFLRESWCSGNRRHLYSWMTTIPWFLREKANLILANQSGWAKGRKWDWAQFLLENWTIYDLGTVLKTKSRSYNQAV